MGLFTGKTGLVFGVANDHSIAWAISERLLAEGAELGFTHLPGDKMERRVRKLAEPAGATYIVPCDVSKDEDLKQSLQGAAAKYGALDFVVHSVAFAPLQDIRCATIEASRQGFQVGMDISVYSLIALAREAAPVLRPGGSIVTMTYFGGEKVVPGYNLMGVCKAALDAAVRYLAFDLGKQGKRINAISAGPLRTLASSAVGDFDKMLGYHEKVSPLVRNVEPEEVGKAALFLLSDLASGVTGEILHVDSGYSIMGSATHALEQWAREAVASASK